MKQLLTSVLVIVSAGFLHAGNASFQDVTNIVNAIRGTNYFYPIPQIQSDTAANVNDAGISVRAGTYQYSALLVVGSKSQTSGGQAEIVFSGTITGFASFNMLSVITNSANAAFTDQNNIYANERVFFGIPPYSANPLFSSGLADKAAAVSFFDANAGGKQSVAFAIGTFSCTTNVTLYARVKQRTLAVAGFPAFIYTNSYVSIVRVK